MIQKKIHFINIGQRPFLFVHFLAIFSAHRVNPDYEIIVHLTDEPYGKFWMLAKQYCRLNHVDRIESIFGNPISNPAHMADVIRLEALMKEGGIYLDLDVVCINPFDPLLNNEFVMGREPDSGLCNAVLLANPDATFLAKWYQNYRDFDTNRWNYHSVVLPAKMAAEDPSSITVLDKYSFFYPQAQDPAHLYLWGRKPSLNDILKRLVKNGLGVLYYGLIKRDSQRMDRYLSFHLIHGARWHYSRARAAYAIHLWEGFWRVPYLDALDPEYLLTNNSNFARLMRDVLGEGAIEQLENDCQSGMEHA